MNTAYVLFGVDMQLGSSYVYFSEQKADVYYRYFKYFTAIIVSGKKRIVEQVRYFVRDLDIHYRDYWYDLEALALKRQIAKAAVYNCGRILVMRSKDIDALIQTQLKKDKHFLISLKKRDKG